MAVLKHSSLEDLCRCLHLGRELGLENRKKDSTIKERNAPCKEEALRGVLSCLQRKCTQDIRHRSKALVLALEIPFLLEQRDCTGLGTPRGVGVPG